MNKQNLVVVTSYPTKGSVFGKEISGLASFAKNTVNSVKEEFNVTVLAELHPTEREVYEEDDVKVKRVWKKNSPFISFSLLKELFKFNKKDTKILLEFELATFGSNISTGLISIFLLMAKLFGYQITTVMHQVIVDIDTVAQHLGLEKGSLKSKIINLLLTKLTKFIVKNSTKVVVLDEIHKQKLSTIINTSNVYVIPHGVEVIPLSIKSDTHEGINLFYFGHITWYKGADWLVDSYLEYEKQFPQKAKEIHLQLAGGMSPTQKNNPKYVAYFNEVHKNAALSKNIEITGYVEEKDFERFFANADIQILPYNALMSSSGPLSHAFEYEKIILLSNIIAPYLDTNDIKQELANFNLNKVDLVFNLDNPFEIFEKILALSDKKKEDMRNFSIRIREKRSWANIGREYLKILS